MSTPKNETETASSSETSQSVSHVAVKPPTFYRKAPETWLTQMESQFALAHVTNPETKKHHIIAALPEDIACDVLSSNIDTYENLKKAIIEHLKASRHELIQRAMAEIDLGDKKPTQVVAEMKRRFTEIGLRAEDDIIKSRLLTALPQSLRSALVGHDTQPLETYAKIADSMVAVASPSPFVSLNYAQASQPSQYQRQSGNFTQNQHSANKGRSPFQNMRPRICNAHIYYANNARTCRAWCKWPGRKPQVLSSNQKTPQQSRSSSPVNS